MNTEVSPEAYFDALQIISGAPKSTVPMSVVELHLYAYLGCLLGLLRGCPVSQWGYSFAVTSDGFPFSVQLDEARRIALRGGLAVEDAQGLIAQEPSLLQPELEILLSLSLSRRSEWLRAATSCAVAFPVGAIRYAINQSPGVMMPLRLGQRRQLLDEDDVELLYSEFKAVTDVLGPDVADLLSPAVLWLSARVLRAEESLPV